VQQSWAWNIPALVIPVASWIEAPQMTLTTMLHLEFQSMEVVPDLLLQKKMMHGELQLPTLSYVLEMQAYLLVKLSGLPTREQIPQPV